MTLAHINHPQSRLEELHYQLGQLPEAQARALALQSLSDHYPPIRHVAARALAQLNDEETTTILIDILSLQIEHWGDRVPKPTPEVVRGACIALRGATSTPRVIDALVRAMEDADADTRYHALESLFHLEIDDTQLKPLVQQALHDQDGEIALVGAQIAAARNFQSLAEVVEHRRSQMTSGNRLHFTLSLVELLTRAKNTTWTQVDVSSVTQELIRALKKEETSVAAAKWLGKLGAALPESNTQRGVIIDALKRQLHRWLIHPHFKIEAAVALLEMGQANGHQYLKQQLTSRRKDVKGYAITIAGQYQLPAFFETITAIAHSTDFSSETAIMALSQYDTEAARRALRQISKTHADPECRQLAQQLAGATDGSVSI